MRDDGLADGLLFDRHVTLGDGDGSEGADRRDRGRIGGREDDLDREGCEGHVRGGTNVGLEHVLGYLVGHVVEDGRIVVDRDGLGRADQVPRQVVELGRHAVLKELVVDLDPCAGRQVDTGVHAKSVGWIVQRDLLGDVLGQRGSTDAGGLSREVQDLVLTRGCSGADDRRVVHSIGDADRGDTVEVNDQIGRAHV